MKAYPHRIVSPFSPRGTPIVALDFKLGHQTSSSGLAARRLRSSFRLENLSDRFRVVPGALINVDPRIFARVEARSRTVFARGTRLGRISQ